MKKFLFVIFSATMAFAAMADDDYREFTDKQGRSILGKVVNYMPRTQTVSFELQNKRVKKVPLSTFSEADQAYIKEWDMLKAFASNSKFRISAKRKETDNNAKSYKGITNRDVENASYEIVLENRSNANAENIEIAYCIFYEQEEVKNSKEVCQQGVYCGTTTVESIQPSSKKSLLTESVMVYKAELDGSYRYTDGTDSTQRGQVHGIILRAYLKTPSGQKAMRQYALPDSLGNSKAWTTSTVSVGMNK